MMERHDIMTESRLLLFTFGWSPEFVIKPLLEEGVKENDVILLLTTKAENEYARRRATDAYNQVRKFVEMGAVGSLEYVEVDINRSFHEICRQIILAIKELGANKKIFFVSGGMRIITAAVLVIARMLLSAGEDVTVRIIREDLNTYYEIPSALLTMDVNAVTNAQLEIMRMLKAVGEATFEDLAVGRSDVTVRKHLSKLRERGLVEYIVKKRKQHYRLTSLGELLLEVLG